MRTALVAVVGLSFGLLFSQAAFAGCSYVGNQYRCTAAPPTIAVMPKAGLAPKGNVIMTNPNGILSHNGANIVGNNSSRLR